MADYNQVGAAYQQAILGGADPVQQAEMLFFHLGASGLSARLASSWVTAIIIQIKGAAGVPITQAFAARPAVDAALTAEVAAHHAAVEAEKASKMRPDREPEGVRLAREAGLAAAGGNGGRPKRAAVAKAEEMKAQLQKEAAAAKDARAARAVVNKARKAQAEALKAAQAAQAAAAAAAPQDMAEAHAAAHEAQAVAEDAAAQADSLSQGFLNAFGDIGFGGGAGGGAGGAGGGAGGAANNNMARQRKSRKQNRKSRKSRKNMRK
jgi:membrane protein involved in colicin uptake